MFLCFRWFSLSNYYKTEIVTWKTWNVTISRVWGSRLGAATKTEIVTWGSLGSISTKTTMAASLKGAWRSNGRH